ncbi:ribonuclease HII [Candidatus Woesebacteria bacterium]|nr:ribonuclease HII [Candidatus Woesebacteria bacterium]
MPHFEYEIESWNKGYTIVGIDEVGRGSLAGPITLGACVLRELTPDEQSLWLSYGLNDSKTLSPEKREQIAQILQSIPYRTYTTSICVSEINASGIMHAWRSGVVQLQTRIRLDYPDNVFTFLIDGPQVKDIPYKEPVHSVSIVKGDTKSISIAAASIVAKVTRDAYMTKLSELYPTYRWEQNKGYGTLSHRDAIRAHGISPWHRTLFVRTLVG